MCQCGLYTCTQVHIHQKCQKCTGRPHSLVPQNVSGTVGKKRANDAHLIVASSYVIDWPALWAAASQSHTSLFFFDAQGHLTVAFTAQQIKIDNISGEYPQQYAFVVQHALDPPHLLFIHLSHISTVACYRLLLATARCLLPPVATPVLCASNNGSALPAPVIVPYIEYMHRTTVHLASPLDLTPPHCKHPTWVHFSNFPCHIPDSSVPC